MSYKIEFTTMQIAAIAIFILAAFLWVRRRELGFLLLAVAFGVEAYPAALSLFTGHTLQPFAVDIVMIVPPVLQVIGLVLLVFRTKSA
jgi:hypothetical protein